ncbi:MAG: family 10 glycosylhydrolase [Syntrophothermus sp.]
MKRIILFLLLIALSVPALAQYPSQKFAMRGVWIASLGIDWPSTVGTSAYDISQQKSQLTTIFDQHKSSGINAIFFHVRPKCDAVYKSSIEPWSRYLTGHDGFAPSDPNYDPLKFAVDEAHKRGMELHAWLNPYRANATGDQPSDASSDHVIWKHPEWIIKCNGTEYRFLDPAQPEVRAYVVKVIMDIVRRYDVDGIHFDDYFYPYTEYGTFNDDASWNKYKGTFTDRTKWRNNNVNLLVTMINDSIKAVKPWVKFGISPSGNTGVNQTIYCDTFGWLKGVYTDTAGTAHSGSSYIDYIMPQLYWVGYNSFFPTWANAGALNGRHMYVGAPAYRFSENGWTPNEIAWEIKTNRSSAYCMGEVYFSSKSLYPNNIAGCIDSLKRNYYAWPAITPKMGWLKGSGTKPNAPSNLRIEKNSTTNKYELKWDKPAAASDGDTAYSYLIYRMDKVPAAADLNDPSKMFGTTGQTAFAMSGGNFSVTAGKYYTVTAFDRFSNESDMSNAAQFTAADAVPAQPVLVQPANNNMNVSTYASLQWNAATNAESYQVQVAKDSLFTQVVLNVYEVKSTSCLANYIQANQKYYWRVKAFGPGGASGFSQVFNFQSGVPIAPATIEPQHARTDIVLNPVFRWNRAERAVSYRFQLATSSAMSQGFIKDTTMADTTLQVKGLSPKTKYFWHVLSINTLGQSDWSTTWGFQTTDATGVTKENMLSDYAIEQNYPNPFNPVTRIQYTAAREGQISIQLFNVLGERMAVLVDEYKSAGTYYLEFDAQKHELPSGIYYYTMTANGFTASRKMILLK